MLRGIFSLYKWQVCVYHLLRECIDLVRELNEFVRECNVRRQSHSTYAI